MTNSNTNFALSAILHHDLVTTEANGRKHWSTVAFSLGLLVASVNFL